MHFIRDSAIKSSSIVDNFVVHPRSCRTTHDEHQVCSACTPSVPEMFKCRHESWSSWVHPRQFVDKDHFPPIFTLLIQHHAEAIECLKPVGWHVVPIAAKLLYAWAKRSQLFPFQVFFLVLKVSGWDGCVEEREAASKMFANKECLSHASTSINRHKLWSSRIVKPFKFLPFWFSADNVLHNSLFYAA